MEFFKSEVFQFEGQEYEIKIFKTNNSYCVQPYYKKDGKPANGYSYYVNFMTDYDIQSNFDFHGYEHLVDTAKSDIENKKWKKYLDAIQELK